MDERRSGGGLSIPGATNWYLFDSKVGTVALVHGVCKIIGINVSVCYII